MLSVARLTGIVALLLGAKELLKLSSWLQISAGTPSEPPHPEAPKLRWAVGGPVLLPTADNRPEPGTADTPTELLAEQGGGAD
mmetsp:Transcript_8682/g.24237  ORF Transcript_8682/g.24237 Transcript_8682/m.24237 type:complete len:83 (-) Transcript_8682:942-1190(-)